MIQNTSSQDTVIQPAPFFRRWALKIGIGLTAIVLLSIFILPKLAHWSKADSSFDRDRLRYAIVEQGDLNQDIHVEGRIVASRYPTLFAPAEGIVSLKVTAGQPVRKGQVLLVVESPTLANLLKQEESAFAAEQAELERQRLEAKTVLLNLKQDKDLKDLRTVTTERALSRAKLSYEKGLINVIDYEKAEDDLTIAKLELLHADESFSITQETQEMELRNRTLQLERKSYALTNVKRQVEELTMTSPVDGVVGSINIDPNDAVAQRQSLMTVIDLSAYEVELRIPESYADNIAIGVPAKILYENKNYEGMVTAISPEVNGAIVTGRAVFTDHMPSSIKQNQRVSTQIMLSSKKDILKVQRGPFVEAGGGQTAYRVEGDLAIRTPIKTGISSITEIEILSGLKAGDQIIISDIARFEGVSTLLLRD